MNLQGLLGCALVLAALAPALLACSSGSSLPEAPACLAPTPTPTPATPTPATPTPTPVPTPAVCTVTVITSPAISADPSVGGQFCTATVVSTVGGTLGLVNGTRTFSVPCSARVDVFANVAPQSSILGALPADWSNACGGSALGVPCVLNPVGTNRVVGLTCSTR